MEATQVLEATQILGASAFGEGDDGEVETAIIGRLVVKGTVHLVSVEM